MSNLLTRAFSRLAESNRRQRDARRLASLPDYLLYDMGLTRDGVPSLSRQLRNSRPD